MFHVLFTMNVVLFLQSSLQFFTLDRNVYRSDHCVCIRSDTTGMAFPLSPLSDNKLQWIDDIKKHLQETSLGRKIDDKVHSLRPLYVLGQYNEALEIYFPSSMDDPESENGKFPKQDPTKFTKDDAKKLAKNMPDVELALLEEQLTTKAWTDAHTHMQLQQILRAGIDQFMLTHPLLRHKYAQLQDGVSDPGDLYQGSRAVEYVVAISDYLECDLDHLTSEIGDIFRSLRETEHLSVATFIEAVRNVQRYISLFALADMASPDTIYTARLVHAVEFNQNYFITQALTVPSKPKTIAEVIRRLHKLPPVPTGSSPSFYAAVRTTVNQVAASVTALATGQSVPPSPAAPSAWPEGFVPKRKFDDAIRARDRIRQTAISLGISPEALRPKFDTPRAAGGRGRGGRHVGGARPDISLAAANTLNAPDGIFDNQVVAHVAETEDHV